MMNPLIQTIIDDFQLAKVFPRIRFCESSQYDFIGDDLERLCTEKRLGNVFNPSFYVDDYLKIIAFRAIPFGDNRLTSYIFIQEAFGKDVFLDISASYSSSLKCKQLIDPKIFRLTEEYFITFNSAYVYGGNDVFVMKVYPRIEQPRKVIYKGRKQQERNWAFFDRDGETYALYWLNPLQILKLKSVDENSWVFEDYFLETESEDEFEGITIGTQLNEWGGKYYLMGHEKYHAKTKKLYLGKSCCLDFDSRSVKFGKFWFAHSIDSLHGHEIKYNNNLFSCTYFSGIQVIDGKVVIGYGINDVDYGFSTHSLDKYMGDEMADIFGDIYAKNMWGGKGAPEFFSGRGSNDNNTTDYRKYIQNFIMDNNVASVVELGCGDFRVGKLIDWSGITYVGTDVVGELIERNNTLYGSKNITFLERDMVTESLPFADLCLVRQVFQHLSNKHILAALPKLKKYKYVLITDGLPVKTPSIKNVDKPTDNNNRFNELYGSGLYLESRPFNQNVKVVLSYLSHNKNEVFRTVLIHNKFKKRYRLINCRMLKTLAAKIFSH